MLLNEEARPVKNVTGQLVRCFAPRRAARGGARPTTASGVRSPPPTDAGQLFTVSDRFCVKWIPLRRCLRHSPVSPADGVVGRRGRRGTGAAVGREKLYSFVYVWRSLVAVCHARTATADLMVTRRRLLFASAGRRRACLRLARLSPVADTGHFHAARSGLSIFRKMTARAGRRCLARPPRL